MTSSRHAAPSTSPVDVAGFLAEAGKKVWYLTLGRGILLVLLGVLTVTAPITTARVLAIYLAVAVIIGGLIEIVEAVRHRALGGTAIHVTLGVVNILFGVVVLAWPGLTALVLVYTIAFWSIVHGIGEVILAATVKGLTGGQRTWGIVSGVISVVFGLVLLMNPVVGLVALLWIIGIWAWILGLFLIGLAFAVRRWAKDEGVQSMGPDDGRPAEGAHVKAAPAEGAPAAE